MNRAERRASGKVTRLMVPKPKLPVVVTMAVPCHRMWEPDMGHAYVCLAAFSSPHVTLNPIMRRGAYIEEGRNDLVKSALALPIPDGCEDYILWIDTDMHFPPDGLLRLLDHKKDFVGCNYRTRKPPYSWMCPFVEGDGFFAEETGLRKMASLPGGFCLVNCDLYRGLPYPWYLATHNGPRDELYFCQEARRLGADIWCDMDLTRQISHIGQISVGWSPIKLDEPQRFIA